MSRTSLFHRIWVAAFATSIVFSPWLMAFQTSAQEKNADVQIWRGKLDTPQATIRIHFELEPDGDSFKGVVLSPDQGNTRLAIHEVALSGDDIRLELKRPKATFTGTFDADRTSIQGMWKQGSLETALNMRLAEGDEQEAKPKETWAGELNAGVKLKVQVRVVEDPETKKEAVYFDSLSQGVSNLKAKLRREDGKLIVEVPAVKGKFEGELKEDGTRAVGLWSQGALKLPLELSKTDEVGKALEIRRPQHPTKPYGYDVEEVSFESKAEGVTLAGTLTLPSKTKKTGKLMAAVLISGSGPQDRDEAIMGHRPFWVIADHLTKQGIAVLRFDDRGTAESTGDHSTATTPDFADDVRGAVEYLRGRPEINKARVGLIGHSEGGLIGPIVTADDHDIAFMVMLAGPGVNGEQIILNQSAAIALAAGESEAMVELQQTQLPSMIEAIKKGADKEEVNALVTNFVKEYEKVAAKEGEDAAGSTGDLESMTLTNFERMRTPWFRYFLTYEPIPAIEKTTCPILSLIGEKDLQVDPKLSMQPLQAAIRKAGNSKSKCMELPGLNHLFQECETGGLDEYQSIEQTFAPSALELMSDWLLSLD